MTSRRFIPVLLAVLTVLASYVAVIFVVIATGAPLSDRPRNRLSEWVIAIAATVGAVTIGLATWRRWRATRRAPERTPM